jgi:carbon dioxide concentrating mechanism protein CcmM
MDRTRGTSRCRRGVVVVGMAAAVSAAVADTNARGGERDGGLVRVNGSDRVAINRSFISPLVERFGHIRAGRGVFVAGNTILRADPVRRVCLGRRTNVQDNVLVLSLIGEPAVRGGCARRATSTGARTSLAHQAEIRNSRVGRFTFIGFRARIQNSVISDGAFVLHGAQIADVRIPQNRLVPVGARITTQAEANALLAQGRGERRVSARGSRGQPRVRRGLPGAVPPPRL